MKRRILSLIIILSYLGNSYSQECIDTVTDGLTLLSKSDFNGSDCLFSVKFCVRKTSEAANVIEYSVYTTGSDIFDSVNVSGDTVGSVICHIFIFVANCNSSASFVAVGRDAKNSICGVVADLIVLPIRLLSFSGEVQKTGMTELRWETASESNSSHFVIQQSKDGKSFLDLAKVKAAGESTILQTYSYEIPNTSTGSSLFSYYRLRMVDRDASYTYSPVITMGKTKSHKFEVYPNPSSNVLYINISDLQKENLKLTNLQEKEISLIWMNENSLDIHNMLPGLYLMKYQNEVIRFIKE